MVSLAQFRRATIYFCGLVVALITLFSPVTLSGSEDCDEPWLSHCIMDTENCLECTDWCKQVVGQGCMKESYFCDRDQTECTGEMYIYYEMCTCKVDPNWI